LIWKDGGSLDADAACWSEQASLPAGGDDEGEGVLAAPSELGQIADQEGQGDVEKVDVGASGDLDAERLKDLGDDEHGPDLLEDDGGLGGPEQMEAEFALDQRERQFDVPAASVQPGDLTQGQGQRIADIGDVGEGRGPNRKRTNRTACLAR